jgi:hypothetical protein
MLERAQLRRLEVIELDVSFDRKKERLADNDKAVDTCSAHNKNNSTTYRVQCSRLHRPVNK